MTPTLPLGAPRTVSTSSNVAPVGFQNKALRLFASLAMDGILRVRINLRRMSERLCRSREWRPCATTSTPFSPRSKKLLVGIEFKCAGHSALCSCDHAIVRNDGVAFDPRGRVHASVLQPFFTT